MNFGFDSEMNFICKEDFALIALVLGDIPRLLCLLKMVVAVLLFIPEEFVEEKLDSLLCGGQ